MQKLTRITRNPEVMAGKPCIRGMGVTVGNIVGLMASGHSINDILKAYPYLEKADIYEALAYATKNDIIITEFKDKNYDSCTRNTLLFTRRISRTRNKLRNTS